MGFSTSTRITDACDDLSVAKEDMPTLSPIAPFGGGDGRKPRNILPDFELTTGIAGILLQRTATTRSPKEDADEWDNVMDEPTGKMKSVRRWPVALQFPLIPATAITYEKPRNTRLPGFDFVSTHDRR